MHPLWVLNGKGGEHPNDRHHSKDHQTYDGLAKSNEKRKDNGTAADPKAELDELLGLGSGGRQFCAPNVGRCIKAEGVSV